MTIVSPKNKLMAVIEKAHTGHYWLMDMSRSTVTDLSEDMRDGLLAEHITILVDAKALLKTWGVKATPQLRVICLSTIKKLLSKLHHQTIKVPDFENSDEALRFMEKATSEACERINKLHMEALVALECQVIGATIAMEEKGLPFNKSKWQEALTRIEGEASKLKVTLHRLLSKKEGFLLFGPEPIDLNNANAVKESLEQVLGRKLEGTSQSSLKDIDHEAVKLLLLYREHARMMSTYGETFMSKIKDERLRGTFVPIGSVSGRFACHDPNLLALPNSPIFQACIEPKPPYQILRFDYGAFELRILASLSYDHQLLNIFNDGLDIHSMVAEAVFKTKVSKTMNVHLRDQAKILNFGIIYGMGEQALAKQLNTSRDQAKSLLHSYFKRFTAVGEYLRSLEAHAKEKGYVKTALGRRAYFTDDQNRGHIARVARNMPIQGTGADIVKLAICHVFKTLHRSKLDAYLINVVHDELVIECHADDSDKASKLVKCEMERAFNKILPDVSPDISVKG